MATPLQDHLTGILDSWVALADPARALHTAGVDSIFTGFGGNLRRFIKIQRRYINTNTRSGIVGFPDVTTTPVQTSGAVKSVLFTFANRINALVGTTISANPQTGLYQAAPAPIPRAFVPTPGPPPTPSQITTLGEVVITDPAEAEAIAAADRVGIVFDPLDDVPVPIGIVPDVPIGLQEETRLPSQAQTVGVPRTFATIAADSFAGPVVDPGLPLNIETRMAFPQQGLFISSTSTTLPSSGGPTPTGFSQLPVSFVHGNTAEDIAQAFLGGLQGFTTGGFAGGLVGGLTPFIPQGPPLLPPHQFPTPTFGPTTPATPGFTGLGGFPGIPTAAGNFPISDRLRDAQIAQALLLLQGGVQTPPFVGGGGDFGGSGAGGTFPFPSSGATAPSFSFPVNGACATTGLPIAPVMATATSICHRAPKGYVVVEIVGSNGIPVKVSMWKPLARSMKLFKSRPRAAITAAEMKTLRTADRVSRKAKKIASLAGFSCAVKGRARRRSTSKR